MTQAQKDRNWKRLCGGKPPPKPQPAPPPMKWDDGLLHPERVKDPHWQWKKFGRTSYVDRLRRWGMLNESKLQSHWDLIAHQNSISPTDKTMRSLRCTCAPNADT